MASEIDDAANNHREWRRLFRKVVGAVIFVAIMLTGIIIYVMAAAHGYLDGVFHVFDLSRRDGVHAGSFIVFAVLFWGGLTFTRRWRDIDADQNTIRYMDFYQQRGLYSAIALQLCTALQIYNTFGTLNPGDVIRSDRLIFTVIMICGQAVFVAFGPLYLSRRLRKVFDDEMVQTLRAKATKVGYISVVAMVCAALILASLYPELGVAMVCYALFVGLSIPLLYYIYLDWRAGRDCQAGRAF